MKRLGRKRLEKETLGGDKGFEKLLGIMENLGCAYAQGRVYAQKRSEKTLILNSG